MSEEVDPADFFSYVKSRVKFYNNGMIDEKEYLQYVRQCSQYFVHKDMYIEKRHVRNRKGFQDVSRARYKIYKRVQAGAKGCDYEYVPYAILRYPHNRWGTLVPSMMTLTLEQFLSQYQLIRAKWRAPPWIYKVEYEVTRLEVDWEDRKSVV